MRKTGLIIGGAVLAMLSVAQAQPAPSHQHFAAEAVSREALEFAEFWDVESDEMGAHVAHTVAMINKDSSIMNLASLRREASAGNHDAAAALGLYHLNISEAHYNPTRAFGYNKTAAKAGVPVAQTSLALQYLNGVGTTRDTVKAAKWFEVAATRGHTQAAYQTGVMYLRGEGVAADDLTARVWLLRAMEAGDERAEQLLSSFATF